MIPINGGIVVLLMSAIYQIKSNERKVPLRIGVSCSNLKSLMQNMYRPLSVAFFVRVRILYIIESKTLVGF